MTGHLDFLCLFFSKGKIEPQLSSWCCFPRRVKGTVLLGQEVDLFCSSHLEKGKQQSDFLRTAFIALAKCPLPVHTLGCARWWQAACSAARGPGKWLPRDCCRVLGQLWSILRSCIAVQGQLRLYAVISAAPTAFAGLVLNRVQK